MRGFVLKEREEALGDAEAEGGRHAVFHRADVIGIQPLCFIVACIAGTLLESRLDTAVARAFVYDSPWFIAWLLVLCVNLIAAVLARHPWNRGHTGFIVTHAGIVTILCGAIIGRLWGVEGNMTLFKGESPVSNLLINEKILEVHVGVGDQDKVRVVSLGRQPPTPENPVKVELEGVHVALVGQVDELGVQTVVEDAGNDGPPALHLAMSSAMVPIPVEQWLVLGDPERGSLEFGPARVLLVAGAPAAAGAHAARRTTGKPVSDKKNSREIHFVFAKMPEMGVARAVTGQPTGIKAVYRFPSAGENKPGDRGVLQLDMGGKRFEFPVSQLLGGSARLGKTPWSVRGVKYFADFRMEGKEPVSISDQPNNPALVFEMIGPPSAGGVAPKGADGAMTAGHSTTEHGTADGTDMGEKSGTANQLTIYYDGTDLLHFETVSKNGTVKRGEERVGGSFTPGWADWKFTADRLVKHAVVREKLTPFAEGTARPSGSAGVLMQVRGKGRTAMRWARLGVPEFFDLDGQKIRVICGFRTYPLGFGVALDEFEVERDEGTQTPAGFRSRVRFVDPKNGEVLHREISMNHPANFPDFPGAGPLGIAYKFSQASWDPNDLNQTTLQVLHDPGWLLKWIGSLVFCAGLILIFYFRPTPVAKKSSTEKS